jgi:hypothetical protein
MEIVTLHCIIPVEFEAWQSNNLLELVAWQSNTLLEFLTLQCNTLFEFVHGRIILSGNLQHGKAILYLLDSGALQDNRYSVRKVDTECDVTGIGTM